MKYLSIVAVAVLILAATPLKAQSAPESNPPDKAYSTSHGRPGGPDSYHGNPGSRGRGRQGWEGERGGEGERGRGREGERGRGWNRNDRGNERGWDSGFWVWVPSWHQVLRFHWNRGRPCWSWDWERQMKREWHPRH
jgi:hypothetical protein